MAAGVRHPLSRKRIMQAPEKIIPFLYNNSIYLREVSAMHGVPARRPTPTSRKISGCCPSGGHWAQRPPMPGGPAGTNIRSGSQRHSAGPPATPTPASNFRRRTPTPRPAPTGGHSPGNRERGQLLHGSNDPDADRQSPDRHATSPDGFVMKNHYKTYKTNLRPRCKVHSGPWVWVFRETVHLSGT
jgi:hypothetical protein